MDGALHAVHDCLATALCTTGEAKSWKGKGTHQEARAGTREGHDAGDLD